MKVLYVLGMNSFTGVVGEDIALTGQNVEKIRELAKYKAVFTTPPLLSHFVKVLLELGVTVVVVDQPPQWEQGTKIYVKNGAIRVYESP